MVNRPEMARFSNKRWRDADEEGGREMALRDLRRRIEDWMAAVAFAEAGDRETALEMTTRHRRKGAEVRKQPRRRNRMELRPSAPGA
jgi:hypothetical protein